MKQGKTKAKDGVATTPVTVEQFSSPESSNVAGAQYWPATKEMLVVFKSGRKWKYFNVTKKDWDDWNFAESKGIFLNQIIKPQYGDGVKEVK